MSEAMGLDETPSDSLAERSTEGKRLVFKWRSGTPEEKDGKVMLNEKGDGHC